jgi:tripartite-type tricarboxylate transporter receptor subunit TctC
MNGSHIGRARGAGTLFVALAFVLGGCAATAPTPTSGGATPAATPAATPVATADDCAGYPAGDVTFVIPYGPGGGFDTWSRLVAPKLQAHLPNGVNVIPTNREGAGGLVGVTQVLNSTPDGYTIVITEPGVLATQQIAGTTEANFRELRAIGRLTVGPETIVVAATSDWQTIEDVQADTNEANPLLMASGGIAAINIVSFDQLDLPYTDVPHDTSADALLSLIRGDTDIALYPLTSVAAGINGGDLRPLVIIGDPPAAGQPNAELAEGVPSLDEVTGNEGIGDALAQTRIVAAPPGTPDCVVAILDQALADVFADEEFLAQLDEAGFIPVHGSAQTAQDVIEITYTTLEGYADLLRENLSD